VFCLFNGKRIHLLKTHHMHLRVDRREICFIQALFEAYDGVATMTTVDPRQGILDLTVSPGREKEVKAIINDLRLSGLLIENLNGK